MMNVVCHDIRDDDRSVPVWCTREYVNYVVQTTLQHSAVTFGASVEVAVVFVRDETIRALNAEHRGLDSPTDVLSFADAFAHRPARGVDNRHDGEPVPSSAILGDIILSFSTIERYATMDGKDVHRAMTDTLSHGVLHLLGYDHSPMMFAIQDRVVEEIHNGEKSAHQ